MVKRQHIRVPYELLDSQVPNEAKKVFIAIMQSRNGTNKQIKVKIKTIAAKAGLKERQVKNYIKILCQNNMLSRKQIRYGDGAWGCNTYTILCDEKYFAEIPFCIASDANLSAQALIAYCFMKRFTNLNKRDYICIMEKTQLAEKLGCSVNHADKVKRMLKKAGYINYKYGNLQIILVYEQQLN